jgi:hypothetical protein
MTISRAFPVFAIAFAVIYIVQVYLTAFQVNLALITYHPQIGRWAILAEAPRQGQGPAMYWYGWLLTAALGAAALAALALALPRRLDRVWSVLVWVTPLVMIGFITYVLRGYFLR